jgi:hypothetical protein
MRKNGQWSMVDSQWNIRTVLKSVVLLLTAHVSPFTSLAQSVSASLDRDKILLGEQVTLQFTLSDVNASEYFVANWPQLNDTLNHAEIVNKTDIDTINVNNTYSYQQKFIITSFDSGYWQLGPYSFALQDRTSGKDITVTTTPLFLTVLPVDVSSLKDYHPIKDIIDVPTTFDWTPVLIGVVILLLAIVVFILIKKRKKKKTETPGVVLKGTAFERALEKLYSLQKEPLSSAQQIRNFHLLIDVITREYFEEALSIQAKRMTIAEMFSRLNVHIRDVTLRKRFQDVFELNAAVKFAKYIPSIEESNNTLSEIINSLREIDDFVNLSRNNANANRMVSKY